MEHHSSHHASRDLVTHEVIDEHGQIRPVRGQGLRHVSIWEQMEQRRGLKPRRVWVEDKDGFVRYKAGKHDTLALLLKFRDGAYPGGRVCVWEGNEEGGLIYVDKAPSPTPVAKAPGIAGGQAPVRPSKGKAKRPSRKIRWP